MFDSFDEMFQDIREELNNGWRDFPVDDYHIATIVYQRVLLECMDDDSLESTRRLRQVKRWVVSYIC